MSKLVLAAIAATICAATPAAASSASALVDLPGSEIRRSTNQGDEYREEVLHLHTNGRLTGNFQVTRSNLLGGGVEFRQGKIHGRWRIVGGRLCIAGAGLSEGPRTCYRVDETRGGKREFAGTNVSTGEIWQMFIYPDEVR
ncbi:MAG: hypothetical protein P8Z76_10370 [Alphaproteobacteria bacterium]